MLRVASVETVSRLPRPLAADAVRAVLQRIPPGAELLPKQPVVRDLLPVDPDQPGHRGVVQRARMLVGLEEQADLLLGALRIPSMAPPTVGRAEIG
jgi:hypothetical protein